jgi:hypothetical protein
MSGAIRTRQLEGRAVMNRDAVLNLIARGRRPVNTLLNRIYYDYLVPSQFDRYEQLLRLAADAGYLQTSIRSFFSATHAQEPGPQKVLVHRHDIDTDVCTAKKIFAIEKRCGVQSSFYFRISTLDFKFMREIEEYGSEASYHYEEIATFAKKHHIRDRAEILARMPQIRAEFVSNFSSVESRFGIKMTTVASHGDFANRRLRLSNTEILADEAIRKHCGIACESYDKKLLKHFDVYISDSSRPAPQYYYPTSPFEAIGRHNRICFLTHPRQWETNWRENTKDNVIRLYEGLKW